MKSNGSAGTLLTENLCHKSMFSCEISPEQYSRSSPAFLPRCPASMRTFLDHAQIARHFFCFFDQGSETSSDAFSPERFAPWVEIKRSEQLNHVLR
jgi:hypothetical protein